MKRLLPYFLSFMAATALTGCDSSDEEILKLISINAIEGKWKITHATFEAYQDGKKISGYEDQPNDTITFHGGTAAIKGSSSTYTYSITTQADGTDYLTLTKNNSKKSVYKITELNLENMRWSRDEMVTGHDGTPHREVETTAFKKIKE